MAPYARYFGEQPKPAAGPPADFVKVYGERPVDRSEETTWLQQLGLWGGLGLPEGVSKAEAAIADESFVYYGMGKPVAFRLTNGARLLSFPDANPKTAHQSEYPRVIHDANIAYGGGAQYIIAAYQAVLRDLGIPVPLLVPLLDARQLGHSG